MVLSQFDDQPAETMQIPQGRAQEISYLQTEQQRLEAQCKQLRLAAGMTFLLALMISMPFPVALLLLLLIWIQESIWRTDQARIDERVKKLETNTDKIADYGQWKTEKMNLQAIQAQAVQPKVLFLYMLLFGAEMTIFGMGMWPQ